MVLYKIKNNPQYYFFSKRAFDNEQKIDHRDYDKKKNIEKSKI